MKLLTQKQKRDYIDSVVCCKHIAAFEVKTDRLLYPVIVYMLTVYNNGLCKSNIVKLETHTQYKKFVDLIKKAKICAMTILKITDWETNDGVGYPCVAKQYTFSKNFMI